MDDKWFKRRQKIAGVTALEIAERLGRDRSVVSRLYVGRQRMDLEQAKVFAEVLNVPLNEVLVRAGVADSETAEATKPSFNNSDAVKWTPSSEEQAREVDQIKSILGHGESGLETWRIKSGAMSLAGYLEGDIVIVDVEHRDRITTGSMVLAQVYDWSAGTEVTIFRRYDQPALVSASSSQKDWKTHIVDQNSVVILGVVVASWRETRLAA